MLRSRRLPMKREPREALLLTAGHPSPAPGTSEEAY